MERFFNVCATFRSAEYRYSVNGCCCNDMRSWCGVRTGSDCLGFSRPKNAQLGISVTSGHACLYCCFCMARSPASLGPLQNFIRLLSGFDSPRQFRLPDLRSLPGAIILLGLVLYPYVYLTCRPVFINQSAHLLEAARTLGCGPVSAFFRVTLPLARPAIVTGMSLALLETLNDIGASEFLGIRTITVTVYTTWISRSDLAGAAQIAGIVLTFVFMILGLEFLFRRKQVFSSRSMRGIQQIRIYGWRGWLLCSITALPVILGFCAPVLFWDGKVQSVSEKGLRYLHHCCQH